MGNIKYHLAIAAAVCFVGAGLLFRLALDREADRSLVTEVPVGEVTPQGRITVNTEKLCYFELSSSIQLTALESGVLGDVAASDAALESPLGQLIPVQYTVLDGDAQEILSETHEYSVWEFSFKSPVAAKLSALQPSRLGRFVKIEPPGDIWVEISIIESDALTGFQLQPTNGGVSVWDNARPWQGLKIGALVLIATGLLAMVWLVTELLKTFLP